MRDKTRNEDVLADFVKYCEDNPTQRFWQALRNWSGHRFIWAYDDKDDLGSDTFCWEGRDK